MPRPPLEFKDSRYGDWFPSASYVYVVIPESSSAVRSRLAASYVEVVSSESTSRTSRFPTGSYTMNACLLAFYLDPITSHTSNELIKMFNWLVFFEGDSRRGEIPVPIVNFAPFLPVEVTVFSFKT